MSSPEAALVWFLKGSGNSPAGSAVTAIVGSRIYWDVLPQGVTYPALRLQRISTTYSEFRSVNAPADYAQPRFQIDCWALDRLKAVDLAQAVFDAVEMAYGIVGDIRVDPISVEDEAGDLEEGIGPNGAHVYRQRLDVFVPYTAAA